MAREKFVDSLRIADRLLRKGMVGADFPAEAEKLAAPVDSADLWLTPKSVDGFDPADFADWPKKNREQLAKEMAAFLGIAEQFARQDLEERPVTQAQSKQARKHLERVIEIVRDHLLPEWLEAQEEMVEQATAAAEAKGWYVEKDQKELLESLLGKYKAPRLRIRTPDREVVLDPICRFGSGRRGIVDLVVMPSYETMYLLTFKDGRWEIVTPRGTLHRRPFNQTTLVNTIATLSRN
jgi:hypothetical protein